jgi:hypothetical protein
MIDAMKLDGRSRVWAVALLLAGGAALLPARAHAHSDVSVQLSWGYPVVVYREPPRAYYYDTQLHYPRYDHYGRPVVVYRYVDRHHPHHHRRGHHHGHHCRH